MIATDPEALFDAETLRKFEKVALAARQIVRGRQRAERKSHQRGASVEFAEYRPFVSGDDWRYIDWNAFARWRTLVLKLFVEEEDLHVHLLLDATGSMDWGEPVKFDQARRVVAGLAYLALANLDRAAVVPLGSGDGRARALPPIRGRERFAGIVRFLAECPVSAERVELAAAVRRWLATRPKRGLVIWVTDLFGATLDDGLAALDRLRYARQEVAVIQLVDASETMVAGRGEFEYEDCETGARRRVVVDAAAARQYRERYEAYEARVAAYGKKYQVPILRVRTTTDVAEVLTQTLEWRR